MTINYKARTINKQRLVIPASTIKAAIVFHQQLVKAQAAIKKFGQQRVIYERFLAIFRRDKTFSCFITNSQHFFCFLLRKQMAFNGKTKIQ